MTAKELIGRQWHAGGTLFTITDIKEFRSGHRHTAGGFVTVVAMRGKMLWTGTFSEEFVRMKLNGYETLNGQAS